MNTRIKELRNFLKLSQKDFSTQIGIKQSTFCDNENRKIPHNRKNNYCYLFKI